MKRLSPWFIILGLQLILLGGCGGHEGGVIDTSENPYQVTEAEQQRMNAANQAPDELVQADADASGDQTNQTQSASGNTSQPSDTSQELNGDNGISYDPQ